ncbi:squamosa promoter-binding-like protein 7 [Magnolia sinica]|uniref:squamosa promoter-binding-like protein 7 n=1 Tax=Magnolia sinica TaxID=86752 RepID=UPI002659A110|nr:squamosa promoter-binding-like protein 7 [Magnolia sinica]
METTEAERLSSLSINPSAGPPEMENPQRAPHEDEATAAAAAWEWGTLLDFTIDDDPSILQWDPPAPLPPPEPSNLVSDRVRKRDPRLICENFLAGLVPCSCPELDEKEEEEGGVGKKRARTVSTSSGTVRCQVPGCEADIRELKGYHRRHRVCLRCANATTVTIDGLAKRYCQQCGKFHILTDFDEGKRSCRRKLERHNNRRRRKSTDCKSMVENEPQANRLADEAVCDGEVGKEMLNGVASVTDSLCLSDQLIDTETILESEDGHGSIPSFQNIQFNSVTSSGETQMEGGKDYSKPSLSSSFCDQKNGYSSVCPTGRMSFKLYDWNPAEFPRRLRLQIFQWLASMPVELEGYIRPGCTILTLFIAMPQYMWEKLFKDAPSYVTGLVNAPESLLSGRGAMHIYLNNSIFKVLKDGSLMSIKIGVRMPKLHYVHPTCFEAGKPMEFVACGNNLFQPKFKFLVSFAGRYLAYDSCISIPQGKTRSCHDGKEDSTHSSDHELFKIYIPSTESNLFGPVFIEVENESGLSNFIPVLFADSQTCSELQMIQERSSDTLCSNRLGTQFADVGVSHSCELFVSGQTATSHLLLDIAWLLKEPRLDKDETILTSVQIHRLNGLLSFLIQAESITILERILQSLKILMDAEELYDPVKKIRDADLRSFQKYMDQARKILHQRLQNSVRLTTHTENATPQLILLPQSDVEGEVLYTLPSISHGVEMRNEDELKPTATSASQESDIHAPLINKEIIMDVNHCPHVVKGLEWPRKTCGRILSGTVKRAHLTLLIMATAAMCFGICVALSHPHEVGRFAVSIRRCLFGVSKP